MTITTLRSLVMFAVIGISSLTVFAQTSPADLYIGTWKGDMTLGGRAMPLEFVFEPGGNHPKGFAVDPGGQRVALAQVLAFESGIVFRLERGEGSFMVFASKLGPDKTSISGDVTIMEGKVERGKALWKAKKVVAGAPVATPKPPTTAPKPPTTAQAAYERGVALVRTRSFRAALPVFTECLTIDTKNVGCLVLRGLSHNAVWNYKEALADLDAAIALSPKPAASFYIARAEALNGVENHDGAIADADVAFKINATPDAFLLRGVSRMKKAGLIYFDSIMRGTDETVKPEALKLAAQGLVEINEFIKLKPQDYRGYLERGVYHYQMWNVFSGDTNMKPALDDLDKALSLSSQNAQIFSVRSTIHRDVGNKAAADTDLAKYNELSKK